MNDIVVGIAIVFVLSLVALHLGRLIGKGDHRTFGSAVIVGLTLLYALLLHGNIVFAQWLPVSNVIIVSNCFPVFAAGLAGLVTTDVRVPSGRRKMLAALLLIAGWFSIVWNTMTQELESDNRFKNGVCLQSTQATCSACAIVTLLSLYGIESDEAEIARLCLTSGRGTQLLGIYRGLKIKTENTPFDVQLVRCKFDGLDDGDFPLVAPIRRAEFASSVSEPAFVGFNWILELLGTSEHCVVMLQRSANDEIEIADPANKLFNPTHESYETATKGWTGVGFRLKQRLQKQ